MLKIKRLLATLIDFYISIIVVYPIAYIFNIEKYFDNLILNIDIKESIITIFIVMIICIILGYILIILKDSLFSNKSLGKKILGLSIIDKQNNEVTNKKILFKRNLLSLIVLVIYPIMIIINNKSLGDYQYDTSVIETKKLLNQKKITF